MIEPRIETLQPKKLVGLRMAMSLSNNLTGKLWSNFMPLRGQIANKLSDDLISLQVFGPSYFANFAPTNEFEKWAAAEVDSFDSVPNGMETLALEGGLYAVFDYKGPSTDPSIFQYIYGTWVPGSGYVLDSRPHFEVLGAKYKNADPTSEEEIWIPIRKK